MASNPKNSTAEEERIRQRQLKLIPELSRTIEQKKELKELNDKLQAREQKKKLEHNPGTLSFLIKNPGASDLIAQDYEKQFANKPNYLKPTIKNGILTLTFKSGQAAAEFFISQAAKGRQFNVMDAQRSLIAFSNGKGTLQHANSQPFKPGDIFTSLANIRQNQIRQNQNMQKNLQLRPLMTPSKPTAQMNPKLPPAPAVKPPLKTAPEPKPQQKQLEVKPTAPRPTPIKRTPFDK